MATTLTQKLTGLAFVGGFFCVAVVLLLSDRAGLAFGEVIDWATTVGSRIERRSAIDVIDKRDVRIWADDVGHAMLWGTGMMLVGWAARRRVQLLDSVIGVASTSLLFEAAQPFVSQLRAFESSDALANLVGIAIGATVLAAGLRIFRSSSPVLS